MTLIVCICRLTSEQVFPWKVCKYTVGLSKSVLWSKNKLKGGVNTCPAACWIRGRPPEWTAPCHWARRRRWSGPIPSPACGQGRGSRLPSLSWAMGYVVVVCGAATGEVDTAERHPQSYLTGLKSGLTPVIVVVVVVRE